MMYERTSRSYNRYFDGFSEKEVENSKGKVKIEHIYTGTYHKEDCSDKEWKRRKLTVGMMYFAAILLYLICGSINCEANSCWYVFLLSGIAFVGLFMATMNVYTKLTSKREMIARVYRSASEQYQSRVHFSAVILLCAAGGVVLNLLISGLDHNAGAFIAFVGYLASGLLLLKLYKMESDNKYKEIENEKSEVKYSDDYVEITY